MAKETRRAALVVLGTGIGLFGLGYLLRNIIYVPNGRANRPGMGGVSSTDMSRYMNMFMRHEELRRRAENIPGGIRTTTESDSPDLVAELQAHVSSMYSRLDGRSEVTCMSPSLPILFHRADDYRREITFSPKGIIAEETATDPDVTRAIREHAREVTGFVVEGMPAMMGDMMDNGMMGSGHSP
jgi:hypothetical protein